MGTLLQEFGHDIVLLYFIEIVLKEKIEAFFYLVNPATGPRIDIHFWNPDKNEYTSAYNFSGNNYIPEFNLRHKLPEAVVKEIDRNSAYQNFEWYKKIGRSIDHDLKDFIKEFCTDIQQNNTTMPDIIGFDHTGQEVIWAELKFEGLGSKAKKSVENQFHVAKNRNVPFCLVIPDNPIYSREITNSWLKGNLPDGMEIYKFASNSQTVIPKRNEIKFIQLQNRN